MGIILSRVRKKKSTIETLEKLDSDIKEIEENQANAELKYKKITKYLLVYSVGLYVLCGIIFYLQLNSTFKEKFLYLVPLAVSPLLLYFVKAIISWYFARLLKNNRIRVNEMKKEKKRILEEVMDKETYKVAKQILDKFSGETALGLSFNDPLALVRQPDNKLRKRIVSSESSFSKALYPSNVMRDCIRNSPPQPTLSTPVPRRALPAPNMQQMRLPASILPLQQSYMDKIIEYLIGDGHNNRYALICSQCHSHNGMALKEEFEYISFKCCYCFFYNPARKVRPEAPKLNNPSTLKWEASTVSESEGENSGENSDEEHINKLDDVSAVSENVETLLNDEVNSSDAEPCTTNQSDEKLKEDALNKTLLSEESHLDETKSENSVQKHGDLKSKQPENIANCDESS